MVELVGDCYVTVAVLPEPDKDHAYCLLFSNKHPSHIQTTNPFEKVEAVFGTDDTVLDEFPPIILPKRIDAGTSASATKQIQSTLVTKPNLS
eukprot:scaffold2090_cov103-Cylindrotheca_fusiformis.AAC.8